MVVVLAGCCPSPSVVASSSREYAVVVDDAAAYADIQRRRVSGRRTVKPSSGRSLSMTLCRYASSRHCSRGGALMIREDRR